MQKLNNITYTLTRSRRRTLAVHIRHGGEVEVRAPLKMPKFVIEKFVLSKEQWIIKKQEEISARKQSLPSELPQVQYAPGEFEKTALELVQKWEQTLDVKAQYVGFRAMSSRWGSCTSKTNRIRINTALKFCTKECLEYIIVHELAHLKESNHSPRFWAIVAKSLPDYKTRQEAIKEMSWLLHQ